VLLGYDCWPCRAQRGGPLANEIPQPFSFEEHQVALDASIGLAIFPDDGTELDALIEAADQAMYAIKRTRKTRRA
jgi:predicted signal transduction protein with EAL and GGDEF domain